MEHVRTGIQARLRMDEIILCDFSFVDKDFGRPTETRIVVLAFRIILERARKQGRQSSLDAFVAGEDKIVHSYLDKPEFSNILKFLKVENVSNHWYVGCINSSGWVNGLSENLYVELLCFIAEKWSLYFQVTYKILLF